MTENANGAAKPSDANETTTECNEEADVRRRVRVKDEINALGQVHILRVVEVKAPLRVLREKEGVASGFRVLARI